MDPREKLALSSLLQASRGHWLAMQTERRYSRLAGRDLDQAHHPVVLEEVVRGPSKRNSCLTSRCACGGAPIAGPSYAVWKGRGWVGLRINSRSIITEYS